MSSRSKWRLLRTEAVNPASRLIDTLPIPGVVNVMIQDHRRVLAAVRAERGHLARAIQLLTDAWRRGGRWVLVGAGTSGRLGVLEAAELPPTFGIEPRRVRAIMAGGTRAVRRAREGVEDDRRAGARAVQALGLSSRDAVIGISASGTTPFVRGALAAARTAGARLIAVTSVPHSTFGQTADVTVCLNTGPEVIAGSTRLKAGTATKIALNILTTAAMVRSGRTFGNLMVDVETNSNKLRDRARRILAAAARLTDREAAGLLRRAGGNLKTAMAMAGTRARRRARPRVRRGRR